MLTLSELEKSYDKNHNQLTLSFLNLTDNDIPLLCEFLQHHPAITSLDLSHNDITASGVKLFVNKTSISSLNISHNNIGPEGAKSLSEDSHITTLDVSFNSIGDDGIKALAANAKL
ncbi:TPA: GALA protein, partial [Legionella pneumophila]|nr:GALA protein [Legionella pneumophila]HAU2047568.1 GALA protein [Legionella pneumophila]